MVRLSRRQHLFAFQKWPVGDDRYPNHDRLFIRTSHHTKKEWSQNQWSKVQLVRNTKVGKKKQRKCCFSHFSKTIYLELHLSSCRSKLSATLILKGWDRMRQSFSDILLWFTSLIFIYIYTYSGFDASNTFQTKSGEVQQKTGKVQESCKNTCLDPSQVNRCIGNRWWYHDKGRPQKAQSFKVHKYMRSGTLYKTISIVQLCLRQQQQGQKAKSVSIMSL